MNANQPPPLIFIKRHGSLVPNNHFTEMDFDQHVQGQCYIVKKRKGARNYGRLGAYWVGLGIAVKNCEAWPTAEHLHHDLKMLCGYHESYINPLTDKLEVRVNSIAFGKMEESEFNVYFQKAQQLFIEKMGFDPWERREIK